MIQFVENQHPPLAGQLLYRPNEYSFDFDLESRDEAHSRAGNGGTTSLLVGTLQIEIGIETEAALYLWGLHTHFSKWSKADLPEISPHPGGIRVIFDKPPKTGVSELISYPGEWQTIHDASSGWICVMSSNKHPTSFVEFAKDTIAGLADRDLVSLWLHPTWLQES
jgi:hypothetical protein